MNNIEEKKKPANYVGRKLDDSSNPIKIVGYQGDRSACAFYRLVSPLHYLTHGNKSSEYKHMITGVMNKQHFGEFDIALFQRQYDPRVFSAMLEMKKQGTICIYEIDDDLFNVPKWNPAHKFFKNKEVQDSIKLFLANCHACFTTQEYLAQVYAEYCPNVFVLPNSIDFNLIYKMPRNSKKPVVCWQGSNTHKNDLALVTKAVKQLVKDDDACVKLWSMDLPGTYNVPLVKFETFFPMLAQMDIDIGLAPISPVVFNKSKSNLKFLEYAALGVPVVASNYGPYKDTIEHGKTGYLVDTVDEWYGYIRQLLDDPDERREMGAAALDFVEQNYDISKNCGYWGAAFNKLLGLDDDADVKTTDDTN